MELSLNALVENLDDHFFARGTREWRVASGTEPNMPPVPELPEIVRTDAWHAVSEVVSSPRVDEAKKARLVLLRRHVARAHVEAHALEARTAQRRRLSETNFFAAARTWSLREAWEDVPRLAQREGRSAVAKELSSHLDANESVAARRVDAEFEGMAQLGLTPETFLETLHGRPAAPRLAAASAMLKDSADAHRDLLGYALKKLDPTLTPRTAEEHDARRAALAPWVFEQFRREDLVHALSRCLGDLGLSQNADGRITVDTDAREGRDARARVVELRVPDSIRLLLTPDLGIETYASWLFHWGKAIHRANVGRTLPFVERRLGDASVIDAVGLLFETFLLDEGWLKRYLRLTANQAREASRAVAFRQLHQLRRQAGLATYSAERFTSSSVADEYRARMSDATGAEVTRGQARFVLDGFGDSLLKLDAYALEHTMRVHLRERFNEDFWRNPATGRWVVDLASRGQRDDAWVISAQLGEPKPDVSRAAIDRIGVMGA